MQEIIAQMRGEGNDRGAALLATVALEAALGLLLTTYLVKLTSNEDDDLFRYPAPLSPFSNKIRIAYAMGLIDSEVRNDLERLREIRNAFAHTMHPILFTTPAIQAACAGLPNLGDFPDLPVTNPKGLYLSIAIVVTMVCAQVSQQPWPRSALPITRASYTLIRDAMHRSIN